MFTVLDRISWPGSIDRANEDTCGSAGDWAWVIDTFIPPGTPAALHPQSDAAWLAGFAGERLAALAPDATDGLLLVAAGDDGCAGRFPCEGAAGAAGFHDLAGRRDDAAARRDGRLDIWTFGDTTAFVRPA